METILARHPAVRAIGENPRAFTLAAALAPRATAVTRARTLLDPLFAPRAPGERVVDKLLANVRMIGPLLAIFPHARFIFPARDPRATGLSIFENPLAPTDHAYSLALPRIAHHLVNTDRVVREWGRRFPAAVHHVSYEELVSYPGRAMPGLVLAAGLDWDASVADDSRAPRRIETLSVAQARGAITTASVARWRRHEAALAPMIDILTDAGLLSGEA